ncbi:MAG: hypothetical protein RL490_1993 [Pseudomonadota bacterium]|jgi:hypothetical protein
MIILGLVLAAGIQGLAPGATVRLKPDNHPMLEIRGEHFDPPVTIKADGSTIGGLRIVESSGIIWLGGAITGPKGGDARPGKDYGIDVVRSNGVRFDGLMVTSAVRGMVIADSQNVSVRNSNFTALRSDGIDAAGSSQLVFENNKFSNFSPIKPTGSKKDGNWKDGDHPDAIQLWTTPTNPRMTDIAIRGNVINGDMQGINFFGPRGQGYGRVTVANNDLSILYSAGVSVFACDECTVTGNVLKAAPEGKYKVNLRFEDSKGRACGNTIVTIPGHPAAAKC